MNLIAPCQAAVYAIVTRNYTNYTMLLRESGKHRFGSSAIRGCIAGMKSIKRSLFHEQNKTVMLIPAFEGRSDALRGKTGKRKAANTRSLCA